MQFFSKDYTNVEMLDDDDLICFCINVDKKTIVQAVKDGADSLKKVREATAACTGDDCKNVNPTKKCCSAQINKLIKLHKG
jgi:NAD(P)H-nitrite reductase large subunit